jgi:hypothetical protein
MPETHLAPEAPNVDQTDIEGLTEAVTGKLGINYLN